MIFKLDASIRGVSESQELLLLAKAIDAACEHGHYVVADYPIFEWIREQIFDSEEYLGRLQRDRLMCNHDFWSPCQQEKRDLTTILVGCGIEGVVSIDEMTHLANENSWVVVENAANDGEVLRKWSMLLNKRRRLSSTYDAVWVAINNGLLRWYPAGGGAGTIVKAIENIKRQNLRWRGVIKYKITTVFDSDKISPEDTGEKTKSLKAYLEREGISYHELMSREIENYFPPQVYEHASIVCLKEDQLREMTPDKWRYTDIEKLYEIEKADVADKLCPNLSFQILAEDEYSQLEEIKEVIMHLAKYI